jgi:hypothetical protein
MSFKTGKWLAIIAVFIVILVIALAAIGYEWLNGNSGTERPGVFCLRKPEWDESLGAKPVGHDE